MTDNLVDLLSDEVVGITSGVPPGTASLAKLFLSGTTSSGNDDYDDISASIYYNGEMVDIGEMLREGNTDLAEEIGDQVTKSRKRIIKKRYPELSEEEVEKVDSEYANRVEKRILSNDVDSEVAEAGAEFVSIFLHGTSEEKWKIMEPVLEDMEPLP